MSFKKGLFITGLCLGLVFGQDYTDECPEKNGFFADAVQCDRYYECKNGQVNQSNCDNIIMERSIPTVCFAHTGINPLT